MKVSLLLNAQNHAAKAFQEVNKQLGTLQGRLDMARKAADKWNETADAARTAGIAITATGVALLAMAKAGVAASMSMEGYQAKLSVVLKSRARAAEMMEWAKSKAAQSPFDVSGVVDAVARMESYGLKAKEWFNLVGDMAGAMSKDVTDAVEAVADAVSGGGLERLKEFGISGSQLIGYGAKSASGGGVDAATVEGQKRLRDALKELLGDRFRGGMAKFAETLIGMWSNLGDAAKNAATAVGDVLTPALKGLIPAFSEMIASATDFIKTPIGQWCVKASTALGLVATALGPLIIAMGAYLKLSAYAKIALGEQGLSAVLGGLAKAYSGLTWAKLKDIAISLAASAANLTLAGALSSVAVAAQAAWKALLGPLGVILMLLGILAGAVALVVRHFQNKAKAAKEAAEGTEDAGNAAAEATKKFEDETKAISGARRAYDESAKSYRSTLDERRRAERDAAISVRDAKESLEDALKSQAKTQQETVQEIVDAEQATVTAREDAAKAAVKASRDISKAEESAAETSRRAVEDMVRSEEGLAKAKQRVAEAEKDIARAMAGGRGDINKAQQDAAQRITDAQGRLRDAQLTAGGVRESEAQRNARALMEAQQDLLQARKDAETSVSQARQKAAEDTARALEQWQEAQQALVTSEQELAQVQVDAPKRIAEAEQQLADARIAAAEATQQASDKITQADAALVKAREDASERIVQADRALRNAQESLVRAQEDAIDRVAQAIERVAKALEDMKQKQADLPTAGTAGKSTGTPARLTPKQRVVASTRAHDSTWEAMGASGAMASGGSVLAGRTYLVGERGPELFTAPATGSIIPNGALTGRTVVVNFNAPIYGDEALRQVARNEVGKAVRVASYA